MTGSALRRLALTLSVSLVALATAQDSVQATAASATLVNRQGEAVGTATFDESDDGLSIHLEVSGLEPGSYGTHVHENGECKEGPDPDGNIIPFGAAGGHLDPNVTRNHDQPEAPSTTAHAGDLPMTVVSGDTGTLDFTTPDLSLGDGPDTVVGRAIIVHSGTDDFQTDPGGNSGERVVCGVILATPSVVEERLVVPGTATYPEGVALASDGGAVFTGSAANGTIYRVPLDGGEAEIFSLGGSPGRTSALGMRVDGQGQLWVAGGSAGSVAVLDTTTGAVMHVLNSLEPAPLFVNDLTLAADGNVYVTDSYRPVLYRVSVNEPGNLLDVWLNLEDTPIRYEPNAINLNGIVSSADGAYLVVAQSNTGQLWRVDTNTKDVQEIPLESPVMGADGLVLDGQTLYVIQNMSRTISVFSLSDDFSSATAVQSLQDPNFKFPTTGVLNGDELLVVNAQLDKQTQSPVLPFYIARLAEESLR